MNSLMIGRDQPSTEIRWARWAVLAMFFLNGVGIASWAAHIPYVKEKFGLSEAVLGLALLTVAAGSVSTLLLGGQLVARFGSRALTIVGAFGFSIALALLLLVPSFPLLILTLAVFGACIGATEVSMNVQALGVEEQYNRPIMSSFHALFSLGGLIGAAIAALLLSWEVAATTHIIGIALTLAAITLAGMRHLLPRDAEHASDTPAVALPTGPLLGLSVLAFFCLVGEGAMADWSAVYLRDTLHTTPGFAAAGYAAFSLAMAAGRFGGDTLRTHLRAALLVRMSGALAAGGLGAALLIGDPFVALLGFACVGLGLSNIVPVLFTAAGRTPGIAPGAGIAAVAMIGYFGFLAGPPMIGFVAELTSLSVGLGLVVLFTALIALLARRATQADRDAGASQE